MQFYRPSSAGSGLWNEVEILEAIVSGIQACQKGHVVRFVASAIEQPPQFTVFKLERRTQVHGYECFVPKSQFRAVVFVTPDDRDPFICSNYYLANQVISHCTPLA